MVRLYAPFDDEDLEYGLRRRAGMRFEGAIRRIPATRVDINAKGYRTPLWREPKPEGLLRVLCLGDSVTFGWGVEEDEAWPARLEARLRADGFPDSEAVSLGVPGYDTLREAAQLEREAAALLPDAVVVQFSSNDFGPGGANFLFDSYEATRLLRSFALFRLWRGEGSIVGAATGERAHAEGVARVVAGLEAMGETLRERGVPGVFLFRDDGARGLGTASHAAREAGFALADYTRAWTAAEGDGVEIPVDGHPTPAGHAILAEAAHAALAPALAEARGAQ